MALFRRAANEHDADQRTSAEATNDLIVYLVVRFTLVLFVVMVAESLAVWLASLALQPILRQVASDTQAAQATTSLLTLLRRVFLLVQAMARGD